MTSEPERRRLHPITPLVKSANFLPLVVVLLISMGSGGPLRSGGGVAVTLAVLLVVALVVIGFQFLSWSRTSYWFDEDGDLRVASGVLVVQERRLQLSRLQSVDVVRPLLARLVGLAAVTVEVAGTGDSKADLRYLAQEQAVALRAEVLARSAGLAHDAPEAPEHPLVRVPTADLFWSLVLRATTAGLLLLTAVVVAGMLLAEGLPGLGALLLGGLPIMVVFAEFVTLFDFTVAKSPDGIRLRYGLLQTKSVTIPPGRVCAVEYVEPWLWRRRSWVRLLVTVAGTGGGDDESSSGQGVLLPVAPRQVADELFRLVMPGVDPSRADLVPVPREVRRRSPVQWSRIAVGLSERAAITRRGLVTRRMQVVDHARVQSVRLTQGPWERRLRLASVHLDLPPGRVDAVALHFPLATAHELLAREVALARTARAQDRSIRWMDDT